jgi:hypothetical protein
VALLRLDCGAGGPQVRYYCVTCWRAGRALPHEAVEGLAVVDGDRELIERAREVAWQRLHEAVRHG